MNTSDARPLIAVTTSEVRRMESVSVTPQGEPPQQEMALGLKYLQALEPAGAIPVVCPPLAPDSLESLLDRVDGLCMSGGPDLDPRAYGERRHERHRSDLETELDEFELALARAADARGLPILAICRGMQVLNVARGGTAAPAPARRRRRARSTTARASRAPSRPTRSRCGESSRVAGVLERTPAKVNSFHHQGVARLGDGL